MSDVFTVNGVEVSEEELRERLKKSDDWSIKTYEDFKRYTAETLLDAANHYFSQTPPDMVQAAEKLWLAAVYSVKALFLKLQVHLVSHSSLGYFCIFAINKSTMDDKGTIAYAWSQAESLHSFSYGSHMPKRMFIEKKQEVEKFVQVFARIDPEELKEQLHQLLENEAKGIGMEKKASAKGIGVEKKDGKIMFGGTNFAYNYRCY